ncbi:hypothetical protein DSO57_1026424 [Entomophthora muscae]|uniref:Uncharacterized protein n=1 Tax=Entomophthora muscae TaxID=34485 RepID=A0ACC2RGR4_9FUNG|nr:hypothetical protein DSO57_1026424 [Entomophthora muscae]
MAKPKAKDKSQTRSQTTRQYETSSEEEAVPDTWEERTDIKCEHQPTAMKTNNTQQVNDNLMSKKISKEPMNTHTPPPQRCKDTSTSPYRQTHSACSSRPRDEDITKWCDLSFSVAAIMCWHKAVFLPEEAGRCKKEGFSSYAATHWKEVDIPLKWATIMQNMGIRNMQALKWMKLSKH